MVVVVGSSRMKTNTFFTRISRAVKSISLLTVLAVGLVACGGGGGGGSYFEGGGNEGTGIKVLDGVVVDAETGQVFPNTEVAISYDNGSSALVTDDAGSFTTKLSSDVTSVTFKVGGAETAPIPFGGAVLSVVLAVAQDGTVSATVNEPPQLAEPSDPASEDPQTESKKPRPDHTPVADPSPDATPTPVIESATVNVSFNAYDVGSSDESSDVYVALTNGNSQRVEGLVSGNGTLRVSDEGTLVYYLQGPNRAWEYEGLVDTKGAIGLNIAVVGRRASDELVAVKLVFTFIFADGHEREDVKVLEFKVPRDEQELSSVPEGEEIPSTDAEEGLDADTPAPQEDASPTPDDRAPRR